MSQCGCGSLGCCLMNSFANAINNLFSTAPYCGCGQTDPTSFTNGFVSGVNAANGVYNLANGGNGGCGCGKNNGADLSAYTDCGNQCGDAYYARQYALCPSCGNGNNGCSCGCGCGNGNGNGNNGCGCGGNF